MSARIDEMYFGGRVWSVPGGALVRSSADWSLEDEFAPTTNARWEMSFGPEPALVERGTRRPIAWFPVQGIEAYATHPNGRVWAAAQNHNLYIFTLEGDVDEAEGEASSRRGRTGP
jgi:hypothetical protein